MRKVIAYLVLFAGIVGYAQDSTQNTKKDPPTGRVGINTTTPQGTLEIVAPRLAEDKDGKLKGTLLDTTNHGIVVPSLTKAEVASLTEPVNGTLIFIKDASGTASTDISNTTNISGNGFYYYVATGKTKGTWANAGSTYEGNVDNGVSFTTDASIVKPLSKVNIIKYAARAWGDWIANLNTNIDSDRYDMSVLSAVLLGADMAFGDNPGPGQVPTISTFEEGKTWRIKADFDGYSTKQGNGTWVFYVMVTPKGTIKYYETETSMNAGNTHNISNGLPDEFKRK